MTDKLERAIIIEKAADQMAVLRRIPIFKIADRDLAAACLLLGSSTWAGWTGDEVIDKLDDETMQLVFDLKCSGYQPPVAMW